MLRGNSYSTLSVSKIFFIIITYFYISMAAVSLPFALKKKVLIRAVSDFACPWCYVGYKRLHNAISIYSNALSVEVDWRPYIIDKCTEDNGEDYLAYNTRRWGGDGWVYDMKKSSRADGCNFSNWNTWINSKHAHRMMKLAHSYSLECADALKGVLFQKYYEEGINISLISELVLIGKGINLNGVEQFLLDESSGYAEVIAEDSDAKKKGIRGVPYFTIECDGQVFTVNGAQTTKSWCALFDNITWMFYTPHKSVASRDSTGSKDFSVSTGGKSYISPHSPLGSSTFHDHYIKPVPPNYVTEYESAYLWPTIGFLPHSRHSQYNMASTAIKEAPKKWDYLHQITQQLAASRGVDFTLFNNDLVDATRGHLLNDSLEEAYIHAVETLQRHDSHSSQLTEPQKRKKTEEEARKGVRNEVVQTDITYDDKTIQKLREFVAAVKDIKSV